MTTTMTACRVCGGTNETPFDDGWIGSDETGWKCVRCSLVNFLLVRCDRCGTELVKPVALLNDDTETGGDVACSCTRDELKELSLRVLDRVRAQIETAIGARWWFTEGEHWRCPDCLKNDHPLRGRSDWIRDAFAITLDEIQEGDRGQQ